MSKSNIKPTYTDEKGDGRRRNGVNRMKKGEHQPLIGINISYTQLDNGERTLKYLTGKKSWDVG